MDRFSGKDLVFVTRHGKLASIVVPVAERQALQVDLRREPLESIGKAVSAHLRKTGVSEGQVLRDFKARRKERRTGRRRR